MKNLTLIIVLIISASCAKDLSKQGSYNPAVHKIAVVHHNTASYDEGTSGALFDSEFKIHVNHTQDIDNSNRRASLTIKAIQGDSDTLYFMVSSLTGTLEINSLPNTNKNLWGDCSDGNLGYVDNSIKIHMNGIDSVFNINSALKRCN